MIINNRIMFDNALNVPGLKMAHINAQSLVPRLGSTKLDEIRQLYKDSVIDILGVSETWFKDFVSDASVKIEGFNIYRMDRKIRRGGGVCLYVSERFKSRIIYERMDEGVFECIFAEILIGNGRNVIVGVVYLPHGNLALCEDELIGLATRSDHFIIMGDLNVDVFSRGQEIRSFCQRSSLSIVHNSRPTHYCDFRSATSLIDFFIVSNILSVKRKCQFQIPTLNSNHAMICITYYVDINVQTDNLFYRDFRNFDHGSCISQLRSIDFSPLYNSTDPHEQIAFFNSVLFDLFNCYVPLRRMRRRRSDDWIRDPEVIAAWTNRDVAFRLMRENRTEETIRAYCRSRNKIKSIIRKVRRRSCINFFAECTQAQMWQRLRSIGAIVDKFEFGRSSRSSQLVYPIYSTVIMSRSFVVKVARQWNTVIPSSERSFARSVKNFEEIFKDHMIN
ncbi:hypothetical protein CVS40_12698 [Lucilia cuprina]|nr:hypothetical protein CVS40_12698 [Lucilia cuprina]